jgi:uncharacterized tellurite resistance protein B-like protein
MGIWDLLKSKPEPAVPAAAGDTDTVRRIVSELEALEPQRARYLAAFAFTLARVAHADLTISREETERMEQIVRELGHLPPEQALLVVHIAKAQHLLAGGTESFLVTREFREIATQEQCRELLDCLFAVAAADESISGTEEHSIRQIASELGLTPRELADVRSAWHDQREILKGFDRPTQPRPA